MHIVHSEQASSAKQKSREVQRHSLQMAYVADVHFKLFSNHLVQFKLFSNHLGALVSLEQLVPFLSVPEIDSLSFCSVFLFVWSQNYFL